MNNIRRIRAIISNSPSLLIAFGQTRGGRVPIHADQPTDLVITNSYLVPLATEVTAGPKDVAFRAVDMGHRPIWGRC